MSSYAERYGLTTLKDLGEHMLANAEEYLLLVPDPDEEGQFVLLFTAKDLNKFADAIDELAAKFIREDNGSEG